MAISGGAAEYTKLKPLDLLDDGQGKMSKQGFDAVLLLVKDDVCS